MKRKSAFLLVTALVGACDATGVDQDRIDVRTHRSTYSISESVTFDVSNRTNQTVRLNPCNPALVYVPFAGHGVVVAREFCDALYDGIWLVQPGGVSTSSRAFAAGAAMPRGRYRIRFTIIDPGKASNAGMIESNTFRLH